MFLLKLNTILDTYSINIWVPRQHHVPASRVIPILDLVITNTSTCSQNITSTDTIQKTPELKGLHEF